MDASTDQLLSLLHLILPEEILEYFTIVNLQILPQEVHLFIDEKNSIPEEFKKEKLVSKGFYPESVIQDFPLRDKPLFLHVRQRKWVVDNLAPNKFGVVF